MGGMTSSQSRAKLMDLEARELKSARLDAPCWQLRCSSKVERISIFVNGMAQTTTSLWDLIPIRKTGTHREYSTSGQVGQGKAAKKPGKPRRGGRGIDAVSYRQMRNWKVHLQSTKTFPRDLRCRTCLVIGQGAFGIEEIQIEILGTVRWETGTVDG